MNSHDKQILLNELKQLQAQALKEQFPDMSIVQQIATQLLNLQRTDLLHFREFIISFQNELFDRGTSLPSVLIKRLAEGSRDGQKQRDGVGKGITEVETYSDWREMLRRICSCLEFELKTLKSYYFVRLETQNEPDSTVEPFRPLLIHAGEAHIQPIVQRLKREFEGVDIFRLGESDVEEHLQNSNFIAMILLTSRIYNGEELEEIKGTIESVIQNFTHARYLKGVGPSKVPDEVSTNELLDDIRVEASTILSNSEITNDEERLIKALFRSNECPVLEYKLIKTGNSGAKVLEVTPKLGTKTKRYIVKLGKFESGKKIERERANYTRNINQYPIGKYQRSDYSKNESFEGILYEYASFDGVSPSRSFAQILDKQPEIIDREFFNALFAEQVFKHWNEKTLDSGEFDVVELYNEYIDFSDIKRTYCEILGICESGDEAIEFSSNLHSIFQKRFRALRKVCHGDLHSENFFRDQEGFYLIDFGFTDVRHAPIDYAMLECSIRFKHLPTYVDIRDLKDIEKQFLAEESFKRGFPINSKRNDINLYFQMIHRIRQNYLEVSFPQSNHLEYLVSVLVLCCRLMRYTDLNQRYACVCAKLILKYLISKSFGVSS